MFYNKNKENIKELKEDNKRLLKELDSVRTSYGRLLEDTDYLLEQKDLRQKEVRERLEKELKHKKQELEIEANIKISEAVQNFKDEKLAEIDILSQELADASEAFAGSTTRADEKEIQIKTLEKQIVDYKSIITDIMKLIPKVDISKFNVNVDVPASEVTVNCKDSK